MKVLVVDDNIDVADGLALMIGLSDHVVRVAYDGIDALRVAEAFRPQIVFIDLLLPGMNGYDVALAMRKIPELGRPILAALTGWAGEDRRARSRAAGFDEHLTKPISYATVERLLALAGAPDFNARC